MNKSIFHLALFSFILLNCNSSENKTSGTEPEQVDNTASTPEGPLMKKLDFSIDINAPVEKVFSSMISEEHYTTWASAFAPGSYFEGSWDEGSKIIFCSPHEEGAPYCMVATVKKNIPNQEIFIQPFGIIENGKEITEGPNVAGLDQSYENYFFAQNGEVTTVKIKSMSYAELDEFFQEAWPKALGILKGICEGDNG